MDIVSGSKTGKESDARPAPTMDVNPHGKEMKGSNPATKSLDVI
jgi:hypothetical protein